ncbi:hypothetical protein VTO42DRAFT_5837 [Malbranchea cinnamomea]
MPPSGALPVREIGKLFRILAVASLISVRQAFLGLFQHRIGSYAYKVNIYGPVLRYVFERVSESHRRALGQPATSRETIRRYCRKHALDLHVQKASEHASLFWIGKPPRGPSSKILLYFHGGGYYHSIQPSHIRFLQQCISQAPAPVSLAILEYTLTTQAPWPAQLRCAVSATAHLLKDYSPSQIILGGDSAGGHLALGLLSHILHPDQSPCNDEKIELAEPFAGAFLISPWVTVSTSAPSYTRLANRDHLTIGRVERFTQKLTASDGPYSLEKLSADPFLSPLNAPEGWWACLGSAVGKLQLAVGTWEIFFDDNCAMARMLRKDAKGTDLSLSECAYAIHSGSVVDAALGIRNSTMSRAVWSWLNSVLGQNQTAGSTSC